MARFESPRRKHLRAGDGALVGWRYWRITRALPDVLISPARETLWEGPVLTAHDWSTEDGVDSHAGIHAMHTQAHARRFAAREPQRASFAQDTISVAVGRVLGYGRYVMGTVGWRAERVVVDKLFVVLFPNQHVGEAIAAFERRYRCLVRVDRRSPLFVGGPCERCGHPRRYHMRLVPGLCSPCEKTGPIYEYNRSLRHGQKEAFYEYNRSLRHDQKGD